MHISQKTFPQEVKSLFAKYRLAGASLLAMLVTTFTTQTTSNAQDGPPVAPKQSFQQQFDAQQNGLQIDERDSANFKGVPAGGNQQPTRLRFGDQSQEQTQPQPKSQAQPQLPIQSQSPARSQPQKQPQKQPQQQPQQNPSSEMRPAFQPTGQPTRQPQVREPSRMKDENFQQTRPIARSGPTQLQEQRYNNEVENAVRPDPRNSDARNAEQYPVRPVTYQQSTQHTAVATNQQADYKGKSSIAKTLIEDALHPAVENLLPGRKFKLEEAIQQKSDRNSRLQLVKDYWKLTVALADYQFANEEVGYISRIAAPTSSEARALWTSEVAAAEARVAEAKLLAMDAQETLRQKLSLTADDLPVATDTPWVGRYRTNFDQHASAGMATENLKRIDRILPVMWQLVQRRAAAVDSSRIAFNKLSGVYQSGGLPVGEILSMHRRLRDQRIAFLAAVRDYNFSIADYAMSTANANGQSKIVTAMLLFDETIGLDKIQNSAVRQASADSDPAYRGASRSISPGSVRPAISTQPTTTGQPSIQLPGGGGFQPSQQQGQLPSQPRAQSSTFQGPGGGSYQR